MCLQLLRICWGHSASGILRFCVSSYHMCSPPNVFFRRILRISPYSVRMRENTDQNNSEYGHLLRSVLFLKISRLSELPIDESTLFHSMGEDERNLFLSLLCLVSTKRSHILKQTRSFQLQVCLSMCDTF